MPKRNWFTAAASSDGKTAEIAIYDEIGYFGVSARDFRDSLEALGPVDTINLRINSPGGEVFDGIAVHNMLARHPATINVTVDGIAASIASVIAMAGDVIVMPENAMMMIHNPAGFAMGMAADMQDMADALNRISQAMASTYVRRTGKTAEEIAALMDGPRGLGTWMTAQEAGDLGFADEVGQAVRIAAKFDLSRYPETPEGIAAAADPDALNATETDAGDDPTVSVQEPPPDPAISVQEPPQHQREEAEEIAAACEIARRTDLTRAFLASKKSLTQVQSELLAIRADTGRGAGAEISARRDLIAGHEMPGVDAWAKTIDKLSARSAQ